MKQQKMVIKIQPSHRRGLFSWCIFSKCDEGYEKEFPKKVMAKIAKTSGVVLSLALKGDARDKVEVIGYGIDATKLTKDLRKKGCRADIESLEEVKEKQKEEGANVQTTTHIPWSSTSGFCHPPPPFCDYVYCLP